MIIIELSRALGNQMFQYAFAKSLAEDLGTEFLLDCSFYEKSFKDKCIGYFFNLINPFYKFLSLNSFKFNSRILIPPDFNYNETGKYSHDVFSLDCFNFDESCMDKDKLNQVKKSAMNNIFINHVPFKKPTKIDINQLEIPIYFIGLFPFEEYFIHNEDLIRDSFKFKPSLEGINKEIAEDIKNTNSIAIHIRRGSDYIKSPNHNLVSLKYYQDAINYMVEYVDNPKFFIFSNDPEWVKENINIPYDSYYVTNNSSEKGFEDLRLMSFCKHFIIANSTFSWWGAWLSTNKDKIIIKPYPCLSSRVNELGNIKSKFCISLNNNYSHYFNDSEVVLAKISPDNFEDFISKKVNVSLELAEDIKLISFKDSKLLNTSFFSNFKIFLKNIKRNNDKWTILKISFIGIGVDEFRIFYLTENQRIYNFEQRIPFYYENNDEIVEYILIPPNIVLDSLFLIPSVKEGNGIRLKLLEFREIETPIEFQ